MTAIDHRQVRISPSIPTISAAVTACEGMSQWEMALHLFFKSPCLSAKQQSNHSYRLIRHTASQLEGSLSFFWVVSGPLCFFFGGCCVSSFLLLLGPSWVVSVHYVPTPVPAYSATSRILSTALLVLFCLTERIRRRSGWSGWDLDELGHFCRRKGWPLGRGR